MRAAFAIFLVISIIQADVIMAHEENFEGNVHLVFDGSNNFEGILQVYTQGKWNTVCYQLNGTVVTNVGAAAAACRQNKYTNFVKWGSASKLEYNIPTDQQPTAITGIRCPEVKFPSTEGDIFLMRCDNSDQLIPTEDCEELVGIQCNTTSSGDQPYNGQVRRHDDGKRTELLQINFNKQWLPVCTKHMSSVSADSVCRQIGYTGSSLLPISSNNNKKSWRINDLSSCNDSFPCFTDCIKRSVGYTLVERCDENQYEVYCQFDKSLDGVYSAGNKYICTYQLQAGHTEYSCPVTGPFTVAVVLVSIVLVITLTLLLRLCCCRLPIDNEEGFLLYTKIKWRQFFCCQCGNQQQGGDNGQPGGGDNGQPGGGENGQLPPAAGGGQGEKDPLVEKK